LNLARADTVVFSPGAQSMPHSRSLLVGDADGGLMFLWDSSRLARGAAATSPPPPAPQSSSWTEHGGKRAARSSSYAPHVREPSSVTS